MHKTLSPSTTDLTGAVDKLKFAKTALPEILMEATGDTVGTARSTTVQVSDMVHLGVDMGDLVVVEAIVAVMEEDLAEDKDSVGLRAIFRRLNQASRYLSRM